jgi:hypothetical protein
MKKLFALVLAAAAVTAGGASANGSPYSPGLVYGWSGVGARDSGVRFVAFGMPKSTIVSSVRARDGHVLRSEVVRGFYGVPLVRLRRDIRRPFGRREVPRARVLRPIPG